MAKAVSGRRRFDHDVEGARLADDPLRSVDFDPGGAPRPAIQ
jgi:hypothetical protein